MGTEQNANTCSSNKSQEADEGKGGQLVLSVLLYIHFYWKESCYLKQVSWGDKGIDTSLECAILRRNNRTKLSDRRE